VRPREDALIAVGGVTALPAAPTHLAIGGAPSEPGIARKVHRTFRLVVERCAGAQGLSVVPSVSPRVRPIAAQAVSAAPWASVLTDEDKVNVGGRCANTEARVVFSAAKSPIHQPPSAGTQIRFTGA
jgi:hypothetical protein